MQGSNFGVQDFDLFSICGVSSGVGFPESGELLLFRSEPMPESQPALEMSRVCHGGRDTGVLVRRAASPNRIRELADARETKTRLTAMRRAAQ